MNNNTNYYYNQLNQNFSPKIYSKTNPYSFYNPNYQSQSSNNKISYNPNLMSNQNPNNFIPPNQKKPIKWRNINKINLPYLKNSRDINLLQSHLDNLINGQINEDDIQSIQENSIVKLIQILQTSSDILLNEQAELENKKLKLESENMNIMKNFQKKDKKFNKQKEEIHRLKKAKNRDIGVINTYLNVLNNLQQGNFSQDNYNITDIEINKKNLNEKNINPQSQKENQKEGEEFKCQVCPDKKFATEFELTKHLEEVHNLRKNYPMYQGQNMPQSQLQILKPEVIVKVPDNLYGMNNINPNNDINGQEIINEIENMQQQFYQKMEEEKLMQEKLNQNQREMQQNYLNNDLSKLENTFKETIDNFKSMLQQQKNNQPTNVFIEESEDDEEDLKKLEELKILKEQLENLKANNNKKKMEYELEEKKYESIVLEINQTKKFNEDEYANTNNNFNTSFNTNIQIQTGPKIFDIAKKNIKKKNYFNSGKIQVDHDDTEEEFEKKKEAIDYLENNKELIINTIRQNQILTNIKPEETTTKIDNDNNNIVNIGTVTQIINPKGTQNEIDLNAKPITKPKKINKELDNYYKRYNKRDKQFLKNNKFSDYLVETLPENYKENDDLDMDELIEDKTKEIATGIFPKNMNLNFEFDEDQIKEESINNLYNLANNLMNDIEEKNSKNKFSNDHYQSIMKTLGFKNIRLTANKIKEKRGDEIIVEKKGEENKINNVINSLISPTIKKDENNINSNINTQINNNNIGKKEEKKEENGGLIMTDIIMDEPNKKEEDILKKNPKENQMNNLDNINNKENQIQNFEPKIILKPDKKDQEVIVEKTTIKEPKDNNLNVPYTSTQANIQNNNNLDVPFTSTQTNIKDNNNLNIALTSTQINNMQDSSKNDNNLNVPYTSTQANIENNNNNNLDVPFTSTQTNIQNNINNNNHLDVPYTSTQANIQENNKNVNNLDAPYTSTQAKVKEEDNFLQSKNINYNNDNSMDMPYNSGIAADPQNQNQNTNIINNINNLNVAYNSVKGPIFNNNIIAQQEQNKIPNMPYTSTMTNNNIPNPNIEQNKPEIKPEINESSKLKESEMQNNVNNNNDTTVIKTSVVDPNDKSMEFDKQVLPGLIKKQ